MTQQFYTLQEAKQFLRNNWQEGTDCPCCGQHVQLYKYPLFATSAYALMLLYKLSKKDQKNFFHVREFAEQKDNKIRSPHFAELRFWGLVEAMDKKTKNSNSSGMWRITEKGKSFVEGDITVQKYIKIYNNKFVGFEGDYISIKEALGNKFDYQEIMGYLSDTKGNYYTAQIGFLPTQHNPTVRL